MSEETFAKIILPLADIPEGAVVTKLTGQKPYVVRDSLTIHHNSAETDLPSTINAVGVRFLFGPNAGEINAHSDRLEVVWHVKPHERLTLAKQLGLAWY